MSEQEKEKLKVKRILKVGKPEEIGVGFRNYFSKYYPVEKVGDSKTPLKNDLYEIFDGKLPL